MKEINIDVDDLRSSWRSIAPAIALARLLFWAALLAILIFGPKTIELAMTGELLKLAGQLSDLIIALSFFIVAFFFSYWMALSVEKLQRGPVSVAFLLTLFALFGIGRFAFENLFPRKHLIELVPNLDWYLLFAATMGIYIAYAIIKALVEVWRSNSRTLAIVSEIPQSSINVRREWMHLFSMPSSFRYAPPLVGILLYILSSQVLILALTPVVAAPAMVSGFLFEFGAHCGEYDAISAEFCFFKRGQEWFGGMHWHVVVIVTLLPAAWRMRWVGRFLARRKLGAMRKQDKRPPILFLRSYTSDATPFKFFKMHWLAHFVGLAQLRTRLDEIINNEGSLHGPAVSLADPDRKSIAFGTSKERLPHDEWKNRVAQLISESQANVIFLTKSESVKWELEQIFSERKQFSTLFIFPDGREREQDFDWCIELIWQKLQETNEYFVEPDRPQHPECQNLVALYFDPVNQQMVSLKSARRDAFCFRSVLRLFLNRFSFAHS